MLMERLSERLHHHAEAVAIVERGQSYLYRDLIAAVEEWESKLNTEATKAQQVVAIQSDFSFQTIALLLALFKQGKVVALISPNAKHVDRYCEEAQAESLFVYTNGVLEGREFEGREFKHEARARHPLLTELASKKHSGFIIFSSGTTGSPKAILHDVENFLTSYLDVQKAFRTLSFLLLDHIAGLDTLFYTLFSGGSLVLPAGRTPVLICQLISQCKVEVLPVSPSFLNLLLLSGEYRNYDLSSLKVVSYGSEPISPTVLNHLPEIFPKARIIQKYGTSEFGSPRSKTRDGDSAWLKLESDHFQTKVEDGILWVKARSTMLGYLNAEGMLEEDGWLCTGDMVEVDDGWLRIIGRATDIINVGGEKVFPIEVESCLNELAGVLDSLVYGEPHPMLGNQVCVRVQTDAHVDTKALKKLIRQHCTQQLERYKVPSKFEFVTEPLTNKRQKKQRTK